MTWLAFSLFAASCWAIAQLIDKIIIEKAAPSSDQYLLVSGMAAVPVLVLGPLLAGTSLTGISAGKVSLSIAAGVLSFLTNALFFFALKTLDASAASAAFSMTPAAAAIGSWVIFGQKITILSAMGLALSAIGAVLMNAERREDGGRNVRKAWIALGAASALAVTEYIIEGYVVKEVPPSTVFYWTRAGVVAAITAFATIQPQAAREAFAWVIRRSRAAGALSFGNGALNMIAIASLIAAYTRGPVGLATGVAYADSALVYMATIGINAIRPKTIPSKGDVKYRGRRVSGVTIVVLGVLVASIQL